MIIEEVLKNKNILFFSVQTFDLEKEIKNKLIDLGGNVDYFDERPRNNNLIKGLIRIKRSLVQNRIDKYYREILEVTNKKHYDFLFVNKGEVIPEFFLSDFKKFLTCIRIILFTINHV